MRRGLSLTPPGLALALGLVACPAPPPRPHVPPRTQRPISRPRPQEAPALVLATSARRYRSPDPLATPPRQEHRLHRACLDAAAELGRRLDWDPRLAHAANTLKRTPTGRHLSAGALTFALQGAGIMEPHARLIADDLGASSLRVRRARVALFAQRVARLAHQGGYNRVGGVLQATPAGGRAVWLLLRSHVRLSPVPRRPARNASILLRGAVSPGFAGIQVVVTSPGGRTDRPRLVAATDGSFHAVVPMSRGRGVYQVEILATGPRGPEVLANFPLYTRVAPPQRYLLSRRSTHAEVDHLSAARAQWTRLQRVRADNGLKALRWHATLARIARAHSLAMCRNQRVHHHSARTGTASDRVQRAGLRVSWVGENVGRAASLTELHRSFMGSPGHRAMRLHGVATHGAVGVCVVRRPGGGSVLYATELFVRSKARVRPR